MSEKQPAKICSKCRVHMSRFSHGKLGSGWVCCDERCQNIIWDEVEPMTPEEVQIKHLNDALQGIVDADIIIDNYMLGPLGKDPDGHLARVSPVVKEARLRLTDRIKHLAAENGIDPERPDLNPDES